MKVATAFYDENNLLVPPTKLWTGDHPTANQLTLQGGYWHICTKYFESTTVRDTIAEAALQAIIDHNGTIIYDQIDEHPFRDSTTGEFIGWRYYVQYVIEEPNYKPFPSYAATADRLGISPNYVQPYDGVAEQGPDYQTPRAQRLSALQALQHAQQHYGPQGYNPSHEPTY
ncbi:MAG: hypothetical protein DI630_00115 [Gordonia sp. (in: high G+C Gram-positive bacteria)]|nr:MAG: hypothetical protein DI630_00115 [Gordonia sp. (in: high G+C Gram-positive bacteria)]